MNEDKPKSIDEYIDWLEENGLAEISDQTRTYYGSVTSVVKPSFIKSDFWVKLTDSLRDYDYQYDALTGYSLLMESDEPEVLIKPYESLLDKTYRKNIIENKRFPDEPPDGWILPSNWFYKINDIIRTLLCVKYLDGAEFITEKITSLCDQLGNEYKISLEAKEEGYYAVHLYITLEFEIPTYTWDTE